jgi:multimeric flavodoxin WrbA
MVSADGIIFGSPVHYSTVSSQMKNLMDRVGRFVHLEGKVGCSLSVGRRSGLDLTISHMLFFMLVKEMIVPGGISWPLSFAMNVGDVRSDSEGLEMARQMGQRVAELATILSEKPVSWKDARRPVDKKSRFGDEWKQPE